MSKIVIELHNISKRFTLYHEKPTLIENIFRRSRSETFWALKNINLQIERGQRVGIIGRNGSGKTTLLKIIAGITAPTSGIVATDGKIVSLIDLEAGFHPDLTGEENIVLNGLLLGMSKDTIRKKKRSIAAFADIGKFIDAPLYTYSDGMKLRLGFAIAAHANPDILILDEGLSVGDSDFQKKSQAKIQEFFQKGTTILVVTHWFDFIRKTCDRVIVITQGMIKQNGSLAILDQYEKRH